MSLKFLVWSNEHRGWWRANRSGYTGAMPAAGRYSFEEAFAICNQANIVQNHGGQPPMETMVPAPESTEFLPPLPSGKLVIGRKGYELLARRAELSEADVCRVMSLGGAIYTVKRISAEPMRYVVYAAQPINGVPMDAGPLHRDGVELSEAMAKIATILQAQQLAAMGAAP